MNEEKLNAVIYRIMEKNPQLSVFNYLHFAFNKVQFKLLRNRHKFTSIVHHKNIMCKTHKKEFLPYFVRSFYVQKLF